MSWIGRVCAIGAIVLCCVAVAGWNAAPQAVDAELDEGAQLFRAKGCAGCHAGPDSATVIGGFPPLTDSPQWAAQRRPGMDAAAYLTESITEPNAFISPAFTRGSGPTTAMPVLGLAPADVEALVDYLLDE